MTTSSCIAQWVSTLSILGLVGCAGGDPNASVQGDDTELGKAEQAVWMSYHGGGGGKAYMSYGNDGYGGVDYYCDNYVMGLNFEQYDGIWRYPLSGGPYGSASGSHSGWRRCPAGQFLIGISGAASTYLEGVTFICGTVDQTKTSLLFAWPQQMISCGRMSTPGSGFTDKCPPGQIVRNFWIRSGSWMDGIQINCDKHVPPYLIP
jgi:hypothetical protein